MYRPVWQAIHCPLRMRRIIYVVNRSQNDYPFVTSEPNLPIHYTISMELRWRLSAVYKVSMSNVNKRSSLISRWEIANVNLFTTIRRRRPGAVQSVCPGVQVSTQHGTWIPVNTLPTCVRRSWSPSPTLSWSWWTGLPPCQSVHVRGTGDVCIRMSYILELAAWQSQER